MYLAFHMNPQTDHTAYFRGVEDVLRRYDGRPHWGKLHSFTASDLRRSYPEFDAFRAVRERLDPSGRFLNGHLRGMLLE